MTKLCTINISFFLRIVTNLDVGTHNIIIIFLFELNKDDYLKSSQY